jgi:hypothetical protein
MCVSDNLYADCDQINVQTGLQGNVSQERAKAQNGSRYAFQPPQNVPPATTAGTTTLLISLLIAA